MHGLTDSQLCLALEDKFPNAGTGPEKLSFLVQYAILAPSVRKSQPWKFEVAGDHIDLFLDRSRNRRITDPEQRELVISCGAALYHLRVAARHFGLLPLVTTFPTKDAELLARFQLAGEAPPTDAETVLFYAIHKWLDVPKPYRTRKKVPSDIVQELVMLANTSRTWMHCYDELESRRILADLIAKSDLAICRREASHARKTKVAHANAHRRVDDHLLAQVGHIGKYIHSFLMRPLRAGKAIEQYRLEIAGTSPVVAILGTRGNTPDDWLEAGQTMASVLLRALSVGLRSSFFNQPVEVPEFRRRLTERLGLPEYPQVMFRIGFPDTVFRDHHVARPSVHEDMM